MILAAILQVYQGQPVVHQKAAQENLEILLEWHFIGYNPSQIMPPNSLESLNCIWNIVWSQYAKRLPVFWT